MSGATRCPPELRAGALRLVFQTIEAEGRSFGVITRIARQLGIGSESSTSQAERIRQLEREHAELPRTNEILKSASAFYARELDPRPPR
jgi:transposase